MSHQTDAAMTVVKDLIADLPAVLTRPTPWAGLTGLPIQAVEKRRYRGINALLLSIKQVQLHLPSHRWAGFSAWRDQGRPIVKGSAAQPVIFAGWMDIEPTQDERLKDPSCKSKRVKAFKVRNTFAEAWTGQVDQATAITQVCPDPDALIGMTQAALLAREQRADQGEALRRLTDFEIEFAAHWAADVIALFDGMQIDQPYRQAVLDALQAPTRFLVTVGVADEVVSQLRPDVFPAHVDRPAQVSSAADPVREPDPDFAEPAPAAVAPVQVIPEPMRLSLEPAWPIRMEEPAPAVLLNW